jgi:2,5-diketo-D-gluconate reductase A
MITPDKISKLGIGTWGIAGYLHFDDAVDVGSQLDVLKKAFDLGANYIDCSLKYADGKSLEAIRDLISYAGRDNLFISAKLEKYIEKSDDVETQLDQYLDKLSIDSVDALQLHAPSFTNIGIKETYEKIRDLIGQGKVMYAGASNFSVEQLKEAAEGCGTQLALHESLFNFSFRQNEDAGNNTTLTSLADKYSKSQSQIILNWLSSKKIVPLIRSNSIEHIKDNFEALDFVMEESDYKLMDAYRDMTTKDITVDWADSGRGEAIYELANKY